MRRRSAARRVIEGALGCWTPRHPVATSPATVRGGCSPAALPCTSVSSSWFQPARGNRKLGRNWKARPSPAGGSARMTRRELESWPATPATLLDDALALYDAMAAAGIRHSSTDSSSWDRCSRVQDIFALPKSGSCTTGATRRTSTSRSPAARGAQRRQLTPVQPPRASRQRDSISWNQASLAPQLIGRWLSGAASSPRYQQRRVASGVWRSARGFGRGLPRPHRSRPAAAAGYAHCRNKTASPFSAAFARACRSRAEGGATLPDVAARSRIRVDPRASVSAAKALYL